MSISMVPYHFNVKDDEGAAKIIRVESNNNKNPLLNNKGNSSNPGSLSKPVSQYDSI
jgi:hypothetical protein